MTASSVIKLSCATGDDDPYLPAIHHRADHWLHEYVLMDFFFLCFVSAVSFGDMYRFCFLVQS